MPEETIPEPLLAPLPQLTTLFPMTNDAVSTHRAPIHPFLDREQLARFYGRALRGLFTRESVQLEDDLQTWKTHATTATKASILLYLRLLASTHKSMHSDLLDSIRTQITAKEARAFFELQAVNENILAETIFDFTSSFSAHMPLNLSLDDALTDNLLTQKMTRTSSEIGVPFLFADQLIALAITKRLFCSSLHCLLAWVAEVGEFSFPGLCDMLRHFRNDTDLHVDFCSLLLLQLREKPSRERVLDIVRKAADIETNFATSLLQLIDVDPERAWVTTDTIRDYIYFLAGTFIGSLGHTDWTQRENPFPWMLHTDGPATARFLQEYMVREDSNEIVTEQRTPFLSFHDPHANGTQVPFTVLQNLSRTKSFFLSRDSATLASKGSWTPMIPTKAQTKFSEDIANHGTSCDYHSAILSHNLEGHPTREQLRTDDSTAEV